MSRTQRGCVGSIHTFAWLLPSVPLLDRSLGAAHPNHPKSLPRIPLTDIPALSTLPAQDLLDECPSFASLLQNSAPFLCFLALPTPQRCRTEIFPLPLLKMTPFPSYLCELEGAVTKKGGTQDTSPSHLHLLAGMFGAPEVFLLEFTAWQTPFGNISCHCNTSQTDNKVPPELLGSHRWHQGQEMSPGTDFSLLPAPREEFRVLLLQPGRGPAPNLCWGNLL